MNASKRPPIGSRFGGEILIALVFGRVSISGFEVNRAPMRMSCFTPIRNRVARLPHRRPDGASGCGRFRMFLCACSVALVSPPLVRAAVEAGGRVVELPTYHVSETRILPQPESWRYSRIQHFEVLSDESDRKTQNLLKELQLLDDALDIVWPGIRTGNPGRAYLIVCSNRGKFGQFVPSSVKESEAMASLFLNGDNRNALVLSSDVELNLVAVDSMSTSLERNSFVSSTGIRVDAIKQLYREYVHFLLSRKRPRLPAWFEEGLAQIIMGMTITPDLIELGKLEDPNAVSPEQYFAATTATEEDPKSAPSEDREFQAALSGSAIMRFEKFLTVERDSAMARNSVGSVWPKQCHAFVHMCLFGENKRYLKPLLKFVAMTADKKPTEALFKEAFGMGYEKMALAIRSYAEMASYEWKQWNLKKGSQALGEGKPIEIRDATQAEIGRIKGETFSLGGHNDAAKSELVTAYQRGERDPLLIAALGAFELSQGDRDRAARFLEYAVNAKAQNPEPYINLARLRFDAAAKAAGETLMFTDVQVASITVLLRSAAAFPQAKAELYELMAGTGLRSRAPLPKEDLVLLIGGAAAFPTQLKLIYEVAALCARGNMAKEAHAFADHGIRYAATPAARARFQQLKAALPPITK